MKRLLDKIFSSNDKKKSTTPKSIQKVSIQSFDYPSKIILAWAKAIEGNAPLLLWLKDNGYEELTIATYAIKLKPEARDWLIQNGFPHLMAMINASEGKEAAQRWLLIHDFELLYHIAMAVEDENDSWLWIRKNVGPEYLILAQSIKKVKDEIEENHNDVHSFGKDL
jgi:hypothetical protein